jgi:hypothetical protein
VVGSKIIGDPCSNGRRLAETAEFFNLVEVLERLAFRGWEIMLV